MKVDITLFEPVGKREMRIDYPELANVPEFKLLTNNQLKFVWHFSNPTSKLVEVIANEQRRAEEALKSSGLLRDLTEEDANKYISLSFPEAVRIACHKMKSFSPSIRMGAKMMQEKIFENLQSIIDIDVRSITDSNEKKQYVDTAVKVSESIPSIVAEIEDAYGVKVKKFSKEDEGIQVKLMDKIVEGT